MLTRQRGVSCLWCGLLHLIKSIELHFIFTRFRRGLYGEASSDSNHATVGVLIQYAIIRGWETVWSIPHWLRGCAAHIQIQTDIYIIPVEHSICLTLKDKHENIKTRTSDDNNNTMYSSTQASLDYGTYTSVHKARAQSLTSLSFTLQATGAMGYHTGMTQQLRWCQFGSISGEWPAARSDQCCWC